MRFAMNNSILKACGILLWIACSSTPARGQEGLEKLDFILGKWKATASDSSFSSVLVYEYSPSKQLLLSTNHLYGKNGALFATYEGAYLFEVDHFAYFIAGPGGETHRGTAEIQDQRITHRARMFPGKRVKSYLSEMRLENEQLLYFANYSDREEFPSTLDYDNPLIYSRME